MTSAESKAPSDGDVGPTFGPWSPRRLFMVLILAICFTSWTVQFSRQHGRLISPPQYDDVVYMNDGADRLEELYVHGFSGLIRSCYRNPPHSPFSTFVAAVSFGIFGLQEWAPYAGNVLVVFFLIGFADRLLQGCHAVVHGLGLAVVFLLPLTQFAVFEFRPDFFAGLLIASGVVSLLATSFVVAPFRHRLLIGVVFGLAFLAKPPLCPFTAVMLLLSVGLGILCEQLLHRPGFWKAVARGSEVVAIALGVALPYYAVNWRHVADYIYQNAIGSGSSIWMYHGSKAEHLLYFLTGEGAQITFSAYSYVVAATLGAALLAVLVWGNAASRIRAVALSLATACAYAVPTLNKVKTPFFGLGFELLLLFCALLSLRFLFSGPWAKGRLFRLTVGGALVVLAGIGLKSSAPCFNWGTRGDGRLGSVEQTCREILQAMKSTEAGRPVKVFLTMHARPINQDTLQWLSRTSGCAYQFVAPALEQIDLDQVKLEMENSLFVLAFDSLSQDSSFDYPSEHLAPATLRLARSLSCLSEVAAFPSFDGTVYHLFKNRFFFGNFGGWSCQEGLNPLEGPYPQWDLPFPVRWGTGSQTRLCLENRDGCPLRLLLSCRTDVAGQVLTICLDGQAVADCAVPASASFRDFDVLLPIREKGQHEVTIRYAVPDSRPQSGGRVVLYKSLQVQAVDPSPSAEPPRG